MIPKLVLGATLGVAVALLVWTTPLGLHPPFAVLLGAAVGAVVAGVPHDVPRASLGALGIGAVVTWFAYALRAGFLPDSPTGRAVSALVVLLVVTVVVAAFHRLPLWAALLGVAAFVGSYEERFVADPTAFVGESLTAFTTLVLTVGVGYAVTSATGELAGARAAARRRRQATRSADGGHDRPAPQPAPTA